MEHITQRAVATIRDRFHEPLGLDDLARSVSVSKFYFLRVFRRTTGVTPGRFLSAVRLHEAKRLLLHTSLSVADVSAQAGYSSTGTFSRRFTALVGTSPTQYRRAGQGEHGESADILPPLVTTGQRGCISGTAQGLERVVSPVFIGAFESPIMQGLPVSWSMLDGVGPFTLNNVPSGTWYLHAMAQGAPPAGPPGGPRALLVGTVGPVQIAGNAHLRLDVAVRPEDWSCPPALLAVPGLDPLPTLLAPPTSALPHSSVLPVPAAFALRRRTLASA